MIQIRWQLFKLHVLIDRLVKKDFEWRFGGKRERYYGTQKNGILVVIFYSFFREREEEEVEEIET